MKLTKNAANAGFKSIKNGYKKRIKVFKLAIRGSLEKKKRGRAIALNSC